MHPVAATSVTPDDLVGAVRTGIAALADPAKAGTRAQPARGAQAPRMISASAAPR
jgi:hypothetical protein